VRPPFRPEWKFRSGVLAARFPALREAKPDWRARAQMRAGDWFDFLGMRAFDAAAPLREWYGASPVAVLTSSSPHTQL
jgi:hypothetical protein